MTFATQHILNSVVTAGVTLVVAWLTLLSDIDNAANDQLKIAFDRIESLESSVLILTDDLRELEVENVILKARLETQLDIEDVLETYMDALDTPAWCKIRSGDRFLMEYINAAHENMYGIDLNAYRGKSDFDVWPAHVAADLQQKDDLVYASKDFEQVTERVVNKLGVSLNVVSMKFYLLTPDSNEYICGIQITKDLTNP